MSITPNSLQKVNTKKRREPSREYFLSFERFLLRTGIDVGKNFRSPIRGGIEPYLCSFLLPNSYIQGVLNRIIGPSLMLQYPPASNSRVVMDTHPGQCWANPLWSHMYKRTFSVMVMIYGVITTRSVYLLLTLSVTYSVESVFYYTNTYQ